MRSALGHNVAIVAPAFGVGLAVTMALASIVQTRVGVGGVFVVQACAAFLVVMAIPIVAGESHPFRHFGGANAVTTTRAVLVALVAGLVGREISESVMWGVEALVVLVAVLDGADGWLASRTQMASAFGARFDMETDAFFVLVLSVLVWESDKAGAWVLLCGAMRYAFVGAGQVVPWLAGPLPPTRRGKTVAIGQFVGLALVLAPIVSQPASSTIAAVTLIALAWSFAVDVRRLAHAAQSGFSGSP
jgi:phosphatidylglycerophosphate synthase